jgi:hypothetical protein
VDRHLFESSSCYQLCMAALPKPDASDTSEAKRLAIVRTTRRTSSHEYLACNTYGQEVVYGVTASRAQAERP